MNDYPSDRRKFLNHLSILSAIGLVSPQWACKEKAQASHADTEPQTQKGSLDKFGLQLYTLRDLMPEDPMGMIEKVAGFGYQQIEGYDGDQGIYWNKSPKDFKMFLDDLGIRMVSSHCDIFEDFEQKAADAAQVGLDYLVCPYIGPQTSVDAWKRVTDQFNDCGRICKENGIRFAYHNHEYTFKAFFGMIPQDFLMENTDPNLVDHQMDIYWVVTGGADPIDYLKKYPGRFKLCHVKDRMKDAPVDERSASCNLGTGSIDFPAVLKVAQDNGMKYFIVEQERYDNSTPLESAEVGAQYLKNLVFA